MRRIGTQDLVHRSFNLLREDIESHIERLRTSNDDQPLTKKEIAFLKAFEKDLGDMETIVENKLKQGSK